MRTSKNQGQARPPAALARIVTTHYRYKPPLKKGKAVAIAGPAIVRKGVAKPAALPVEAPDRLPEQSANDDHKPTIVTTISRKRAKLERAERAAEPDDDPEATARVRAFLDRMMRPR